MPRVFEGRDLSSGLCKKGFFRNVTGKHIQFFLENNDAHESGIVTMMSHGMLGKTISANVISQMAKQCQLSKNQFIELVDCRLSEKEYRVILREKGFDV